MAKYFKVVEINKEEFINAIGEDLDCCQMSVTTSKGVFVAIDEEQEDEIRVPLDCFVNEKGR